MTKLTEMQLVLLATAYQRDDGSLLPPPASIGTQAARIRKAVTSLIKRTLASECDIADKAKAWREKDDRHIGVIITETGRAVIAAKERNESADAPQADGEPAEEGGAETSLTPDAVPPAAPDGGAADLPAADTSPVPRTGTKQSLVLELLRRDGGANIDELAEATGWLPHTTRAALTGLRKKGHAIVRTGESGASRYQLAGA